MQVTASLVGILNLGKTVRLEDRALMRQYMQRKGVPLLDLVNERLGKLSEPFDRQTKATIEKADGKLGLSAGHVKGEKYSEHHENDFREWE